MFYCAVTRRQLLPFQKPVRPVVLGDPGGPAWPTATQSAADRQVTSKKMLAWPLPCAGTRVTAQALPFQVSAAARWVPPDSVSPTATQRLAAAQETLFVPPPGMVAYRQRLPSQISLKLTPQLRVGVE